MNDTSNRPTASETAAPAGISTRQRVLKLALALVFLVLSLFAGSRAGDLISNMLGEEDVILSWGSLAMVLVRSILGVIAFLLLGGKTWFRFEKNKILKAAWFALPMLAVNLGLGGLVIESIFIPKNLGGDGGEFAPGAVGNVLFSLVLMILVGINEEVLFRGLGFGGLLTVLGRRKNGVLIAAILTSLAFGYAHVMFDIDFHDINTVIAGLLKMLQAGMLGIVLCYCVISERDIWGAVAVHAFFDWIIMVGALLKPQDYSVNYVATESPTPLLSDSAMPVIQCIFYVFVILVYLPRTIRAIRLLREIPPADGPFAGQEPMTAERTA